MTILEQLECGLSASVLKQGTRARVKNTGQIIELKPVSGHGISVVSLRTGGEHFISNKFLEPVRTVHHEDCQSLRFGP
jgi:hypothetical protein